MEFFKYSLKYLKAHLHFLFVYLIVGIIFFVTLFLQGENLHHFLEAYFFVSFFLAIFVLVQLNQRFQEVQAIQEQKKRGLSMEVKHLPQTTTLSTEYLELVRELQSNYLRELNKTNAQKEELTLMLAMWSHQIKVPISVLDLMVQTNEVDIQVMKDELIYVNYYVEMMLQFMRMQNVHTDYVFEKVDLEELVNESVKKYARFFIKKHLSVQIEVGESEVITDAKWVQFVFEQVLFNALKYTNEGGIQIRYAQNALWIQDSGIGISKTDLPRIFEHGFTGFNGRIDKKASGLGLYLSKKVMKELGGEISITSELGVGTTVKIDMSSQQK